MTTRRFISSAALVPSLCRSQSTRNNSIGPGTFVKSFHTTVRANVKVGDSIPDVDLVEGSPGNKINLGRELRQGKGLIIGVPAAYSQSLFSPFRLLHVSSAGVPLRYRGTPFWSFDRVLEHLIMESFSIPQVRH